MHDVTTKGRAGLNDTDISMDLFEQRDRIQTSLAKHFLMIYMKAMNKTIHFAELFE